MSKKTILFLSVFTLIFFLNPDFSLVSRSFSLPEQALEKIGGPDDNGLRERLTEIFDSLDIENERSRSGLADRLDQLYGQFLKDREDLEEFRRIIRLIITLLTDKDLFERAKAAAILGNLRSDFAVMPLIVSLLHDPHFYVRESSAQALGKLRNTKATQHLIKAICRDSSKEVINHSINSLGFIRDTRALDTLIYVLTGNEPVKSNYIFFPFKDKKCNTTEDFNLISLSNAAIALGRIKDQEATPALVQALNHRIYLIRLSAAQALSLIKDPDSLEPLQERLEVETSDSVKAAIENAIYQIENL